MHFLSLTIILSLFLLTIYLLFKRLKLGWGLKLIITVVGIVGLLFYFIYSGWDPLRLDPLSLKKHQTYSLRYPGAVLLKEGEMPRRYEGLDFGVELKEAYNRSYFGSNASIDEIFQFYKENLEKDGYHLLNDEYNNECFQKGFKEGSWLCNIRFNKQGQSGLVSFYNITWFSHNGVKSGGTLADWPTDGTREFKTIFVIQLNKVN